MASQDDKREEADKEELMTGLEVGVRVFFTKYGSYLLLLAAFALLGWQVWNYFQKKHMVAVQDAWADLEMAMQTPENEPAKLQTVIADHDIKTVQAQAYLALGNYYLTTVALGIAPDVPGAKYDPQEQIARAHDAYTHAANDFPDDRLVTGAGRLGLGAVAEDQADWAAARKQYQSLVDPASPFAGTAFADQAGTRLANLDRYKDAPRLASGSAAQLPPGLRAPPGQQGPAASGPSLDNLNLPGGGSGFMLPSGPMAPETPAATGPAPAVAVEPPPPATAPASAPAGTMPH